MENIGIFIWLPSARLATIFAENRIIGYEAALHNQIEIISVMFGQVVGETVT